MLDISLLLKEGMSVLRKNYILSIPTAIAVIVGLFLMLAVAPTPEEIQEMLIAPSSVEGQKVVIAPSSVEARKMMVAGLMSMLLGLYAYGITMAMAREALETGTTSIGTAAFIASRLSGTFLLAAVIVSGVTLASVVIYILPGLVASFFLMFTFPSIVVDSVGAVEAVKRSITVTRMNLRDSVMLYSLTIALVLSVSFVYLIVSTIPVLGQLAGLALLGSFGGFISVVTVRAYKTLRQRTLLG